MKVRTFVSLGFCFALACSPADGQASSSSDRPDAAVIRELEQEHEARVAKVLALHPEWDQDVRNAFAFINQTKERMAAGKLDEALGEEIDLGVQGTPILTRDARARQLASAVEVLSRFGVDDPVYDLILWQLAEGCMKRDARSDAQRALRYITPALDGFERSLHGRLYRGYTLALETCGMAQMRAGHTDAAVEVLERALKVNLALDGKNDRYAGIENNLGEAYRELGNHNVQARTHLQAAEALINAARAHDDNQVMRAGAAAVYNNLSLLATDEGDYETARREELRSLAMHDLVARDVKNTPDEKWAAVQRAMCLRHLASLDLMDQPPGDPAVRQRRDAEAEGHLKEAITLLEMSEGPDSANALVARLTLGLLYAQIQDYQQVIRQMDLVQGLPEPENPQLRLESFRLWTALALKGERYDIALKYALKWLSLTQQAPGDPSMAGSVHLMLGLIYTATRENEKAEAEFKTALAGFHRSTDYAFAAEPERRQLTSERTLRVSLDAYLSFKAMTGWQGQGGYDQVLAWKGTVFARQAAIRRARASTDPAIRQYFAQLEKDTAQIQSLVFDQARDARPQTDDPAWRDRESRRRKQMDVINARIDETLEFVATTSSGRRAAPLDVRGLQNLLPPEVALIDFLEYAQRPARPLPGQPVRLEQRYVAYIVRGDLVIPVDLGPSSAIESALGSWTKAQCADPRGGLAVRQLIWDKLAPHLAGVKVVLVSPDTALGSLPFGALPENDGEFLLERYAFATIPVPQLLRELLNPAPPTNGSAVVISAEVSVEGRPIIAPPDSPWAISHRLSHAAVEVANVRQRFEAGSQGLRVRPLFGPDATKAALRREIASASYLHYAGHAFFYPEIRDAIESQHRDSMFAVGDANAAPAIDPSLLCGLVLAPDGRAPDDGALTAYEIARMDLRKVNLAVLSGCDTAVGEAAGGEGLLSLQRGCHIAGARTVIASLWPVEDVGTERLMNYFYAELLADPRHPASPLIALRHAQLKIMHEPPPAERHTVAIIGGVDTAPSPSTRQPPAVWAPWVLSGSPGELATLIHDVPAPSRN